VGTQHTANEGDKMTNEIKKITIETESYNERRYGKPWIAIVDFSEDKKGEFVFGDWIGTVGYSGTLEIEAEVGTIIAQGQKDNRKPANSAPEFFIVKPTGELESLGHNKNEAYKAFRNQTELTDTDKLILEKQTLLKRLAEIDELLSE
jgi:hypothetical protein